MNQIKGQKFVWLHGLFKQSVVYRKALSLLWSAAPFPTALMVVLLALQGVLAPILVWLMAAIVGRVSAGQTIGVIGLVIAWSSGSLISQLVGQWVMLLQANLNELFTSKVESLLMKKANALPDLSVFETQVYHEDLQLLSRLAAYRPLNLLTTTVGLIPELIASAGMLLLIGQLAWWLPLMLVCATLPLGRANSRLQEQSWQAVLGQNPLTRMMRYLSTIATTENHAKEIRLYSMGPYLERRYAATFAALREQMQRARLRQARGPITAAVLFGLANAIAFWWVVERTLHNELNPGEIVLLLQVVAQLQDRLWGISNLISVLGGHLLFFEKLFSFLSYRSPMVLAEPGIVLSETQPSIRFEHVSLHYPNGTPALENISFELQPGERVALVGENGAGKTTLIKLLCRLYDPTSGKIYIDKTPLEHLDLTGWRARFGVVFQDFGRYQLSIAENIALGCDDALENLERLGEAARKSGFDRHIEQLGGFGNQLGVQFGGAELSGGQWQALALTRAFARNAQLLILDEPTAALDPRAEYELFERFSELAQGKTTILVTHRLASVRMVDRILVLKRGQLIEQGSHDALMALEGEYAALYRMQAKQFEAQIDTQIDTQSATQREAPTG